MVQGRHRKTNCMINLRMVMGEGADERDCGEQHFAHMPRTDDIVVSYIDGRMVRLRVSELYHYPASSGGPSRTPFAMIRVQPG